MFFFCWSSIVLRFIVGEFLLYSFNNITFLPGWQSVFQFFSKPCTLPFYYEKPDFFLQTVSQQFFHEDFVALYATYVYTLVVFPIFLTFTLFISLIQSAFLKLFWAAFPKSIVFLSIFHVTFFFSVLSL